MNTAIAMFRIAGIIASNHRRGFFANNLIPFMAYPKPNVISLNVDMCDILD